MIGIAVPFKEKFGGVDELKAQQKQIGEVAVLKRGERYVYYMITKENYWYVCGFIFYFVSFRFVVVFLMPTGTLGTNQPMKI